MKNLLDIKGTVVGIRIEGFLGMFDFIVNISIFNGTENLVEDINVLENLDKNKEVKVYKNGFMVLVNMKATDILYFLTGKKNLEIDTENVNLPTY